MSDSYSLLGGLFGAPEVDAVFTDTARLQAMLDVEAALARAQARCAVIPAGALGPIEASCQAALYDVSALGRATALAGNPAIPLVKALTAQVARDSAEAARWVHWGATSQDIIDTGAVLQLRVALGWVQDRLQLLCDAVAGLADAERGTGLPGRTLLQQAVPVTFGLKAAGWLDALQRSRRRLQALHADTLVLQFGGAAGTLASLQTRGLDVAEFGSAFALLTGTLGKIATDIVLLMQSEVAEAFEPAGEGKGGSSAMPHKRNPVGCVAAIAAASRVPGLLSTLFVAMPQPHERAAGQWHAEWETVPEIVRLCAGSLAQVTGVVQGLQLDRARMQQHLDSHGGLLYAEAVAVTLAEVMGKSAAHALVEHAARQALAQHQHLRDVLAQIPEVTAQLSPTQLDALFAPDSWRGMADTWIDRVLAQR